MPNTMHSLGMRDIERTVLVVNHAFKESWFINYIFRSYVMMKMLECSGKNMWGVNVLIDSFVDRLIPKVTDVLSWLLLLSCYLCVSTNKENR